jgi:hypothetical protein
MVTFHPSMDNYIFMIRYMKINYLPYLPTYPPTYLPMENDILKISCNLLLFFFSNSKKLILFLSIPHL